jgi:FKBP-type peptidyl-prolyl cis-trans isomerase (trigger factor)
MYEEGLKAASKRNITLVCSIQKIAEELDIKVTEQDVNDYFSKVAKLYGMTEDEAKNKYRNSEGIEAFLFQKKTYDELFKFYK